MRSQNLSDKPLSITDPSAPAPMRSLSYGRRESTYADLDLLFRANPVTGDLNPLRDTDAVKRSVVNLVLTNFNERPFQPEIGSGVRGLLFEPADEITIHGIEEAVRRVINNFEPRVRILDIASEFFEDENAYRLTLEFQILSTEQVATSTIVLERIR
jgi:phage baseplate assembly protein W